MVKAARRAARSMVEVLPPEILQEFHRNWAVRVPDADHDRFLIALRQRMDGTMGTDVWIETLNTFGVLD